MVRMGSWKDLLNQMNEVLANHNIQIEVLQEDNTFNLDIKYANSYETYACNYYEEELIELLNEAYDYIMCQL